MAGRSWSAIWSWLWPSRVRRPASVMMIWKTLASAIPRSFAICGRDFLGLGDGGGEGAGLAV